MADTLTTISVDSLNKAVNKAVGLSRLPTLSDSAVKSEHTTKAKIASKVSSPKTDHVFIKPSAGVPRRRVDSSSSARSVPGSPKLSPSLQRTSGPTARTTKTSTLQSTPTSKPSKPVPVILPAPSTVPTLPIVSSPQIQQMVGTTLSSPVIHAPLLQAPTQPTTLPAPTTITSPVIHTLPAPTSGNSNSGITFQFPLQQAIPQPQGAQFIGSYLPQGSNNIGNTVLSFDGKTLKFLPGSPVLKISPQGAPALTQPVTLVQPQSVLLQGQAPQPIMAKPVTASAHTQIMMSPNISTRAQTPTSCSNIEAPDLLAAATQAAVPHLITRYPAQKPPASPVILRNENAAPLPKVAKIIQLTGTPGTPVGNALPGSIVVNPAYTTMPIMVAAQPTQSVVSSPTVQHIMTEVPKGSQKRKVYAVVVNPDGSITPSKGPTGKIIEEFDAYHPPEEAKSTEPPASFNGHFCMACNRVNKDKCNVHNAPITSIGDTPILSQARGSLPSCLRIYSQGIGGVETTMNIKKYTRFGPLVGVRKQESESAQLAQTPYHWQILSSQTQWIDCSDENQSNWMRFVRQAALTGEQNVVAFLEEDSIYFMALDDLDPNTELRYWFSEDYAKHIGKSSQPGGGFTCMPCLKTFDSLYALNQHCRYSHPDTSKRKHVCVVCSRAFVSVSKKNTHMSSHTGQKPHQCQYCEKSFSDQSNLRMHLLIHSDVRKFTCTVCKRSFKQKAHLTSHMLTHTGEKNMECEYCGRMFARRSDLRQHELQHTRECVFKCEQAGCDKVFYKMQNLKKHQKIHIGVRDHVCDKCEKPFATAYHLKRHTNSVQNCQRNAEETAETSQTLIISPATAQSSGDDNSRTNQLLKKSTNEFVVEKLQ